jgi:hypothetical protein
MRLNAKLASDPVSTVRAIVIRPMKKLLPNWRQKSSTSQYPWVNDGLKAVEGWVRRPDEALELYIAFIAIERDQQHVVNGRQRPDQERDAEYHRRHFGEKPPQPMRGRSTGEPNERATLTIAPFWSGPCA